MAIPESQMQDLMRMIAGTAEAIGGQLTPTAAAVIAGDLRQYDMPSVALALAEIRRTAKGRFSLSDILRILEQRDGRPHGDEAWSIAMIGYDESSTVVITEEIQMAMGIAQPVVDAGDMIGGRRTFLASYDRLVNEARSLAKPCIWNISLGIDKAQRSLVIEDAVRLGRLSAHEAAKHLKHVQPERISQDGQAIAGLLTGKSVTPTERNREQLRKLRDSLISKRDETMAITRAVERQERTKLNAKTDQALGIGDGIMPVEVDSNLNEVNCD